MAQIGGGDGGIPASARFGSRSHVSGDRRFHAQQKSMDPKRPREEDEQTKDRPIQAAPDDENEIDENERAGELEEVVGPQPGGGEESGHS